MSCHVMPSHIVFSPLSACLSFFRPLSTPLTASAVCVLFSLFLFPDTQCCVGVFHYCSLRSPLSPSLGVLFAFFRHCKISSLLLIFFFSLPPHLSSSAVVAATRTCTLHKSSLHCARRVHLSAVAGVLLFFSCPLRSVI